jgi:hypothetical protein
MAIKSMTNAPERKYESQWGEGNMINLLSSRKQAAVLVLCVFLAVFCNPFRAPLRGMLALFPFSLEEPSCTFVFVAPSSYSSSWLDLRQLLPDKSAQLRQSAQLRRSAQRRQSAQRACRLP